MPTSCQIDLLFLSRARLDRTLRTFILMRLGGFFHFCPSLRPSILSLSLGFNLLYCLTHHFSISEVSPEYILLVHISHPFLSLSQNLSQTSLFMESLSHSVSMIIIMNTQTHTCFSFQIVMFTNNLCFWMIVPIKL